MSFAGVGLGAGLLSGFIQESEGELNLLCYIYVPSRCSQHADNCALRLYMIDQCRPSV